jgi:uncharacterized membrane protein
MGKGRLEAFSDGVIAILITIMVLELHAPKHHDDLHALRDLAPIFVTYVLSFVHLAIYWNNHHHLVHTMREVSGGILWANLHLLFWLSLFPFFTAWMGENSFAKVPVAAYGVVLLCAAVAYYTLQSVIMVHEGPTSRLRQAVGRDVKGKLSPILYVVGILLALVNRWVGYSVYVVVALMWLVPDRRLERMRAMSSSS